MSKSRRNLGPAWSRRSEAATRRAISGARSASADIVVPSTYSITITSRSSSTSTIRGEIPVVAAAAALCRSFARSTASSSVERPGIRTT
jgi:hypothetical protein